ncbi:hypothetical protein FRA35_02195 [Escherichia coli]|nr:hypothetical protein FRA35_02195 [Escherichia coli]
MSLLSALFSTTTLSDAHRGEENCFSFFSVGYNHLSCCVSLPANFCPDAAVSDITVDVVSEVQRR